MPYCNEEMDDDDNGRDEKILKNCMKLRIKFQSNTTSPKKFKIEPSTTPTPSYVRKQNLYFNKTERVQVDYCLKRQILIRDYIETSVIWPCKPTVPFLNFFISDRKW